MSLEVWNVEILTIFYFRCIINYLIISWKYILNARRVYYYKETGKIFTLHAFTKILKTCLQNYGYDNFKESEAVEVWVDGVFLSRTRYKGPTLEVPNPAPFCHWHSMQYMILTDRSALIFKQIYFQGFDQFKKYISKTGSIIKYN